MHLRESGGRRNGCPARAMTTSTPMPACSGHDGGASDRCRRSRRASLTIRFGGHVAVDHVSCAFQPGTLTAIVGPNGAGKTTYFNLISGQLPATAGAVLLDGEDVTALGRARAHAARPRPRLPAHQSLSPVERRRERAPRGPGQSRRSATTCCGLGAARAISIDARRRRARFGRPRATGATRSPRLCRTATSASSKWR